ncbi:YesL family protein [Anaerococcus cruorum]|uniref:YesL family protein n=1 Tax=Anaerococcus sp. WGS1529 TaxID=3366812 RepID=UPI00372D8488
MNDNKLIKIGNFLGDMFILQAYFICYSLRGGIILGVFPSFMAIIDILSIKFYKKDDEVLSYLFKKSYKENFKKSNQVGWTLLLSGVILFFDYYINKNFINNKAVGIILLILLIIYIILASHMPITLLRFDLSFKNYFKQAMLIALSSPFELISVILSELLIEQVLVRFPILMLFLGVSLMAMPFAWFTYRSVEKIKDKKEKES